MADRAAPRGFTLVETLVVVAVMGLIAVAIAAVFAVIVRTAPSTEARADDARTLLGISTWLPADVSATPVRPVATATDHWDRDGARASGCPGTDPGSNLVRLSWSEPLAGTTIFIASYRLVDDGGESSIVRVTCDSTGARAEQLITASLPPSSATPVVVTFKEEERDGTNFIVGLEMEITTFDGDTLRVDASSRNPDETLFEVPDSVTTTTTVSSTTTTTTTTSTTTTTTTTTDPSSTTSPNSPPTAEPVTFEAQRDQAIAFTLLASDPDGDSLEVEFATVPEGWTLDVTGLDVTVAATNPAAGTYVIGYTVEDPFGESASSTVTVTLTPIPCDAVFVDIDPNPVANTGNGNAPGGLSEPVDVTIAKSGDCSNLVLRYELKNGERVDTFGDSLVVTLESTESERWKAGDNILELVEFEGLANEVIHGTAILAVT